MASRRDFFCHAATADNVAALQNERGISGASKIGGCREAVVASANHNRVEYSISTQTIYPETRPSQQSDPRSKPEITLVEQTTETP